MKELVILRGLPGSGKSTFAKLLTTGRDAVIIENDQYMYEDGIYVWSTSKIKAAVKDTNERLYKALVKKVELIVISNVNARANDFSTYIEIGNLHGYKVSSIIVENRAETKSIHNVEDETMQRMSENFQIKLK